MSTDTTPSTVTPSVVAPGASLPASRVALAAAQTEPTPTMRRIGKLAHAYARAISSRRGTAPFDKPAPVRRAGFELTLEVAEHRIVAGDVAVITLVSPDGADLPEWRPGAHIDLTLADGTTRQYSLNSDPAERDRWRIAVRRIDPAVGGRGGSIAMHELQPGTRVEVIGPRNAFSFVDASAYRFVAGGIGITPILPMVREAAAQGKDWHLVYTGRSKDSLAFLDELADLDQDRITVRTDDEHGLPDVPALLADLGEDTAVYLCGPGPMIDAARAVIPTRVADHTLRGTRLHTEHFSPPPVVGGTAFTVTLARTGTTVPVAADESLLTALERAVPTMRSSCRQGFCGSCEIGVLKGEIDHRGRSMRAVDGQESMLVCVSRAAGDHLVVDL